MPRLFLTGFLAISMSITAHAYHPVGCKMESLELLAKLTQYRNRHARDKKVPGDIVYTGEAFDRSGVEVQEYAHVIETPDGPIKVSHVQFRNHGGYYYISDTWTDPNWREQKINKNLIQRMVDDHPEVSRYLAVLGLTNYQEAKKAYKKGLELEDVLMFCPYCKSMASAGFSKVEEGSIEWNDENQSIRLILTRP